LLRDAGCDGLPLAQWLRDKFFEQHVARFQKRPFIWHVWDGHKEGFSALVNYHLLTREKLNTLINLYLGDWITQQKRAVDAGNADATLKLAKAEALKAQLEAILEGEPPYDIFVRWKPLHQQPIGWDPDINDGVRMNIRPFVEAGVLRIPRAKARHQMGSRSRQGCRLRALVQARPDLRRTRRHAHQRPPHDAGREKGVAGGCPHPHLRPLSWGKGENGCRDAGTAAVAGVAQSTQERCGRNGAPY
jgi:hypothetical protein